MRARKFNRIRHNIKRLLSNKSANLRPKADL